MTCQDLDDLLTVVPLVLSLLCSTTAAVVLLINFVTRGVQ